MLALPRILFALAVACGGVSAAGDEVRIIFRNSPLSVSHLMPTGMRSGDGHMVVSLFGRELAGL